MPNTENTTETALAQKGSLRWCLENQESPYMRRLKLLLGDRMPYFNASLINLGHSKDFKSVRPASLISAGIVAATLDLPIDKNLGFAYIIPYGDLAQFQMGYRGYIQLALRSGRYAGMNAVSVNAEALGGYDDIGDPLIKWDLLDETKDAIGYAFAWKLTSGFTKIVYWPKTKVTAHAQRYSQAYKQQKKDSPWFSDFDKMALKTLITIALKRWGIMSVEDRGMQLAFERDQSAAIDVDGKVIYPDNDEPPATPAGETPQDQSPPANTLDDLTARLASQQGDQFAADMGKLVSNDREVEAANVVEPASVSGNVSGTVTPLRSVVEVAAEFLGTTPQLSLVQEAAAVTEPTMTLEQMEARLEDAKHVSDVRALQLLWTGPSVNRSDEEKIAINKLCASRIEAMKKAAKKGPKQ